MNVVQFQFNQNIIISANYYLKLDWNKNEISAIRKTVVSNIVQLFNFFKTLTSTTLS